MKHTEWQTIICYSLCSLLDRTLRNVSGIHFSREKPVLDPEIYMDCEVEI